MLPQHCAAWVSLELSIRSPLLKLQICANMPATNNLFMWLLFCDKTWWIFQSSALTYYNFRALGVRIGELHSHNLRDLLFETGPSHMVQADTHVPSAGVCWDCKHVPPHPDCIIFPVLTWITKEADPHGRLAASKVGWDRDCSFHSHSLSHMTIYHKPVWLL